MIKRALVINNATFENLVMKNLFQKLNFSVEATDEYNALLMLEQFNPQVVVVNYSVQLARGEKLIQLMRITKPSITYLMNKQKGTIITDDDSMFDGIIESPITLVELENLLNRFQEKE